MPPRSASWSRSTPDSLERTGEKTCSEASATPSATWPAALGDAQAGDACTGKPTFSRGASIDPESTGEAHGHALQDVMVADAKPIEYVHFGRVHSDDGTRFPHAEFADDASVDLPGDGDARAAMFRAGLLRETLLLAGFVGSTSDVMAEYDASQGSLGDVVDAASSLMGGGGAGTAAPDAAGELGRILSDIGAAGGQAAVPDIAYEARPHRGGGPAPGAGRSRRVLYRAPRAVLRHQGRRRRRGRGWPEWAPSAISSARCPASGMSWGRSPGSSSRRSTSMSRCTCSPAKPMEPIIADASYRLTDQADQGPVTRLSFIPGSSVPRRPMTAAVTETVAVGAVGAGAPPGRRSMT